MIAEDGWGEAIPILVLTGAVGFASLNPPYMGLRDPAGCVTTRRANHFDARRSPVESIISVFQKYSISP